ncbi:hypothetical protein L226DRAFT_539166 [Lentinus tigrinus ALCF2SS1-7]|uniref:F-box domain-containing protein n=1 Tax=Lentinus tigrinus ALCF2SS1-6 TaxID=1328759 RepID=A0A5C2RVG4_9APHY|nr:hypothetical protein L227DRAFT_311744 [Lentinus tigrinus ALCF2SS1-6]RPD70131.1 hypothetical protein L226DRAFT_539166 [Lentinus tigrinus ALCF2SS1-7]
MGDHTATPSLYAVHSVPGPLMQRCVSMHDIICSDDVSNTENLLCCVALNESRLSGPPPSHHLQSRTAQPRIYEQEVPMSTPSLPYDVWDIVFEHSEGDKRTLMHCSLVCETWASLSQRRLFTTLTYSRRSVGTPRLFAQFLASTPRIAAHVRSLTISKRGEDVTIDTLTSMIHLLPNLRVLHLRLLAIVDTYDVKGPDSLPQGHTHRLTSFKWWDCAATDRALYTLLGCFSSITHLELSNSNPVRRGLICLPGVPPDAIPSHLSVERLSVRDFPMTIVSSLVRRSRMSTRLNSAEFLTSQDVQEQLGAMLCTITSLRHFQLLWRRGTDKVQHLGRLRLAQCTSLVTLHFTLLGVTFVTQGAGAWLLQILDQVAPHLPRSLRVMRLGLVVPRKWSVMEASSASENVINIWAADNTWAEIDRRLLNFPSWARLEFVSAAAPYEPFEREDVHAVRAYMRDRLPGVAGQGWVSLFEDI